MGNDQSTIPGIEIVEKAIEVCDYWTHHSAEIINHENVTNLTVFVGEHFVSGTLWSSQTPLEKNVKHMMIYRHPCIIKYVSSWQRNSKFYLAVEEITPLSQELSKLNCLQISIGLYSILKALSFLHTNAEVSHNNICVSSLYVSKEGNWKLGGMEYLCKYIDLSCDYLNKSRSSRYNRSMDPNESKLFQNNSNRKDIIDIYAFGILAVDILKSFLNENNLSSLTCFLEYCKNDLLNPDPMKRPTFKQILEHDFFNQDFIIIHSFLLELPLKNDSEKLDFFQNITQRLLKFESEIVASQLSGLLLSRMVLLNKTAHMNLLPMLLSPRTDEEDTSTCLFSEDLFKKYLCPKILEIFKVRDVEIRLLLLTFFPKYVHTFSKEELENNILPELLVGIKDTNDHLVSVTLKTLATLVPILGSKTVVGGKRAKLFNDGRPIHSFHRISRNSKSSIQPPSRSTTTIQIDSNHISLSSLGAELNNNSELPERPRPDGEENETSTEEVEPSADEDLDNWEDWDVNESLQQNLNESNIYDEQLVADITPADPLNSEVSQRKLKTVPDILELDIKNQIEAPQDDDFNFFEDMEPVIENCNKFIIDESNPSGGREISKKLAIDANGDELNAAWEEEEWG